MSSAGWPKGLRFAVVLAGIGFAVHVILPQVKELPAAIHRVETGSSWWILAAFGVSLITYVGAAISLQGSLEQHIGFWPAVSTQLATSFTSLMAPQGVGSMTTYIHFLDRQGVQPAAAATAVGLNTVAGVIVHVSTLIGGLLLYGRALVGDIRVPPRWELLVAAAVAAIVLGILVWSPLGRKKIIPGLTKARSALGATLRHPARAFQLFGGSALITFSNAIALALTMDAFGRVIPLGKVVAVYLAGAAIASIAPTPGGLGALEAALVAGLTAVGAEAGTAVGGVLVFRLLTFWLPILPGAWMLRRLRRQGLV